jgi:hypothetical protein
VHSPCPWTPACRRRRDASGAEVTPPAFAGSEGFKIESDTLHGVLVEARVHKTPQEVALLGYVNDVGSRAHVAMMQVRAGGGCSKLVCVRGTAKRGCAALSGRVMPTHTHMCV